MREIARRAELGIATLYRHFPARNDLVRAVLADRVAACETEIVAATRDPNPWAGLETIVRSFARRQLEDRSLNEALLGSGPAAEAFATERRAHATALTRLVARAHDAGEIRPDIEVADVRAALRAIASLRDLPPSQAQSAISRVSALMLSGMKAPAGTGGNQPGCAKGGT